MTMRKCSATQKNLAIFLVLSLIFTVFPSLMTNARASGLENSAQPNSAVNWYIVNTAEEFIKAVNSDGTLTGIGAGFTGDDGVLYTHIKLGSDITIQLGDTKGITACAQAPAVTYDTLGTYANGAGTWSGKAISSTLLDEHIGIRVGNKSQAKVDGRVEMIVDGGGHTLKFDWPHTIVAGGNFYFSAYAKVSDFTMQNIRWLGSSEIGCYASVLNTDMRSITFDNVTYKGPGMSDMAVYPKYNPQLTLRDCDITMTYRGKPGSVGIDSDGYGGAHGGESATASNKNAAAVNYNEVHSSETVAANFINIEGSVNIHKYDSPAMYDIDPIFYLYWGRDGGAPYPEPLGRLTIRPDAQLIVDDDCGATASTTWTHSFIGHHVGCTDSQIEVGDNATLVYKHVDRGNGIGNGFVTDFHLLDTMNVGNNATVLFDTVADKHFDHMDYNDEAGWSTYKRAYFFTKNLNIGNDSSFTYKMDFDGNKMVKNDNSMLAVNNLYVGNNSELNIIADNNTVMDAPIRLRSYTAKPVVNFDVPKNILLYNSKTTGYAMINDANSTEATLNVTAESIRAWKNSEADYQENASGYRRSYDVLEPSYIWPITQTYTATIAKDSAATIKDNSTVFDPENKLQNLNIISINGTIEPDIILYKITYDGNGNDGGTPPIDNNGYKEGDTITLQGSNDMTKTGAKFIGWTKTVNPPLVTNQAEKDALSIITEYTFGASDVTLYAVWEEDVYTGGIVDLDWMRSSELVADGFIKSTATAGNAWEYNEAMQRTPIKYFHDTQMQAVANAKAAIGGEYVVSENDQLVGTQYIWDRGTFFDKYKIENGNVSYKWASWMHTGMSGNAEQGEYSIRRFTSYVDFTQNELDRMTSALLAPIDELGNMSYLFPINDTVFVFVNGKLAYWGGTDVVGGGNQHGASIRSTFMGKEGIKLRNGVNGIFKDIYPHTDGWCIDLEQNAETVNIKSLLHDGSNRIDIITDDYWEGGGMNRVYLFSH